jgi:hypothetical protein
MTRIFLGVKFRSANLIMIIGVAIMFSCTVYAIVDFYRLDSIIKIWMPFMISGVLLSFLGALLTWNDPSKTNKRHYRFLHKFHLEKL